VRNTKSATLYLLSLPLSLPPSLSLSLSLSLPLLLLLHRPLPSLSRTFGRVVLRVEPLFYIAATRRRPLVESRPAEESLRSFGITIARVRSVRHSSLIAPNCMALRICLTRAKSHIFKLHALPLVTQGANRTRFFEINISVMQGGRPVIRSMPASAVASSRALIIRSDWKELWMSWEHDDGKIMEKRASDNSKGWFIISDKCDLRLDYLLIIFG